ncbi:MAG: hypothetical protein D6741_18225 [Planctomycetota bacterium]|nr:MAG: hypothetical protein D6741_18225 [Planctomycetota bacterium]
MLTRSRGLGVLFVVLTAMASGCRTQSEQGALVGGLIGAGTGALIGDAVGNPTAGTAIGAGIGAMTGATIGDALDRIDAENRARIRAQLGRELSAGAVTYDDVIAMTAAGVSEELIINHIEINGMEHPPTTQDLINLQQAGVSTAVIKAMQKPSRRQMQSQTADSPATTRTETIVVHDSPPPVVIHEYHDPFFFHHRRVYHYAPPRPGVAFGFHFHD